MKKIKKLIIFDLDNALGDGNAVIDTTMGGLLNKLLELTKVAIISDGDWPHFEQKLLPGLPQKQYLKNLINLPINGIKYFEYRSGWKELPTEDLTAAENAATRDRLLKVLNEAGLNGGKVHGEQFAFNGPDITFSALGEQAPAELKQAYDPDQAKRRQIKSALDEALFGYSVKIEGADRVIISKTGIDKSHGIYKLHQILGVKMHRMLHMGNALAKGGDDYAATTTGVEYIQVKNLDETKKVMETIIACLHMGKKRQ